MWPSEPGVGRFGLPDDFGPPHPQDAPIHDPKYMITNKRFCHMPNALARRLVAGKSDSAVDDARKASMRLSSILRHGDRRIQPCNEGG
eukprot:6907140-Heterocapsa_arctica.AAC.1